MNEQNCSNAELEKNILHKNIKDISDTLNFIHSKEKIKYFKKLENPSSLFSTFLILYLWSGIFIGWYLTAWIHFLFFPISIVIISINQRTLRNILHDASHNNLYSNQKLNEYLSNFFAGYPLFEKTKYFRKAHLAHHRYLGIKNKDPDFVCINELDPTQKKSCYQIYIMAIRNKKWLKSSNFGNLYYFNYKEILEVFFWWFIFLVTLIYIFSLKKVIIFLILWFVSKATLYHFLKVFMEISDHAGLEINGIIKSTRSMPNKLSSMIFFPFGDNYHLTHHLLPKIPTIKLRKAHKILIEWDNYQKACFPKRYFFGRKSVIMNWVIHRKKSDFT